MTEPEAEPQGAELLPCPWCKAVPRQLAHYFEIFHQPSCFLSEFTGELTRKLIHADKVKEWNTRADLPRATAEYRRGLSDALAIAERHWASYRDNKAQCGLHIIEELRTAAANTPRATGETVEAALAELREISPGPHLGRVFVTQKFCYSTEDKGAFEVWSIEGGILGDVPFVGRTLADCMAQVRAVTEAEGKVNDG